MKTVLGYLLFLALVVHFHTAEGPKPLYEDGFSSTIPERVIADINHKLDINCLTEENDYLVGDEKILETSGSFIYQVEFAASALSKGQIVLEEKHSGEIVLRKMECPGKNGQWYSYTDPSELSRQIAGIR